VLQSGGLELTVSNPDEAQKKQNDAATIYLAVVLYSVAGLAAFRFVGAMWFLVVRMVSPMPLTHSCTLEMMANITIVPRCVKTYCPHECGAMRSMLAFGIGYDGPNFMSCGLFPRRLIRA